MIINYHMNSFYYSDMNQRPKRIDMISINSLSKCNLCQQLFAKLMYCPCGKVRYCTSTDCQKKDRKQHKSQCKIPSTTVSQ